MLSKLDILGVGFDSLTMDEAVARTIELIESKQTSFVVTPNAEIAYECLKNKDICNIINRSDLVVPDGAGVVLASRIVKNPVKQKVAGVELAEALLGELAKRGKRLFLLGAKPGVAQRAAMKMISMAPGLIVCGTQDGYFKTDKDAIDAINEARPDLVFVCLGAPKQEIWMHAHAKDIVPCTMMGLGGTLDIFAGEATRAPEIYIKLNLEWLHRLMKEPSRIGRMMRLPKYILAAVFKGSRH